MTLRRLKRTIKTGGWLSHSPLGRPLATQARAPYELSHLATAEQPIQFKSIKLRSWEGSRQRQSEDDANVGTEPDVVVNQSRVLLATLCHGVILGAKLKLRSCSFNPVPSSFEGSETNSRDPFVLQRERMPAVLPPSRPPRCRPSAGELHLYC